VAIRERLPRPRAPLVTLPCAPTAFRAEVLSCTAKITTGFRCLTGLGGSARSGCRLIASGAAVVSVSGAGGLRPTRLRPAGLGAAGQDRRLPAGPVCRAGSTGGRIPRPRQAAAPPGGGQRCGAGPRIATPAVRTRMIREAARPPPRWTIAHPARPYEAGRGGPDHVRRHAATRAAGTHRRCSAGSGRCRPATPGGSSPRSRRHSMPRTPAAWCTTRSRPRTSSSTRGMGRRAPAQAGWRPGAGPRVPLRLRDEQGLPAGQVIAADQIGGTLITRALRQIEGRALDGRADLYSLAMHWI